MCFKAFKYTNNIIIEIDLDTKPILDNIIAEIGLGIDTNPSLNNVIADNNPNTNNNSISYVYNTDNNIVVIDPHSEEVLAFVPESVTLVPASENKITVIPRISYNNTNTIKINILRDNKAKVGIYH